MKFRKIIAVLSFAAGLILVSYEGTRLVRGEPASYFWLAVGVMLLILSFIEMIAPQGPETTRRGPLDRD